MSPVQNNTFAWTISSQHFGWQFLSWRDDCESQTWWRHVLFVVVFVVVILSVFVFEMGRCRSFVRGTPHQYCFDTELSVNDILFLLLLAFVYVVLVSFSLFSFVLCCFRVYDFLFSLMFYVLFMRLSLFVSVLFVLLDVFCCLSCFCYCYLFLCFPSVFSLSLFAFSFFWHLNVVFLLRTLSPSQTNKQINSTITSQRFRQQMLYNQTVIINSFDLLLLLLILFLILLLLLLIIIIIIIITWYSIAWAVFRAAT